MFGEKYKNLDEMDRKLDDKVIEEIFRLDTKEMNICCVTRLKKFDKLHKFLYLRYEEVKINN